MYIYVARLKRSAMGGILQVAVISLLVLVCHGNPKEIRSRQISAVDNYDDEVYKILIKLCKGTFHVPVAKRTATQKSTIIRYWRNRESYSVEKADGSLKLLFNGKPVVKKSELKSLVTSEFKHCKGIGSRKLKHRLNQRFSGFSEPCVNKILSKSKLNQMSNARFNNKVIIRPIRASAVQMVLRILKVKSEDGDVNTQDGDGVVDTEDGDGVVDTENGDGIVDTEDGDEHVNVVDIDGGVNTQSEDGGEIWRMEMEM
ncbi:hypothetical protein AC249_AIPGENE3727 [Exaiptasia diaphana]|nr:hypothetical protein AC249_AIPGENE3727 [Exaiptasia diaphana]